ncbi:hypothetical protein H4582DRAFT_2083487 [Lactarius indigo]|nr:hypothetical protein H4582DRAFT_2083487 [Lactarius indigo]
MLQFSRQEVAERVGDHALREAVLRASFPKRDSHLCPTAASLCGPLASQATSFAMLDAIAIPMALSDPAVVLTLPLLKIGSVLAAQAHSLFAHLRISPSDLGWGLAHLAARADTTGIRYVSVTREERWVVTSSLIFTTLAAGP